MLVSKYQLTSKCQWLGTLDYNGEECEVFFQFGIIYIASSGDLSNKELSNVNILFSALI